MRALRRSPSDREILRLAVPALGALAADPLVSIVDTAFIGRLGALPLASLGVAVAVFGVAFALFNFLAYGTTPDVAAAVGVGRKHDAGAVVRDAVTLGAAIGFVTGLVIWVGAEPLLRAMGATGDVLEGAVTYLRIRVFALPAVLVITAAHGAFRGYQDTRTPLVVTVWFNLANVGLDAIAIFGLGWGLAGAAGATVVAQWFGAGWFLVILVRRRGDLGITLSLPGLDAVRRLFRIGGALVTRTGALLLVLTLATAVAARMGTVPLAAHQILSQLWLFLALVVDAFAIAGQALIGKLIGSDKTAAREVANRLLVMGLGAGMILGGAMWALAAWLPGWFTSDATVVAATSGVFVFVVVMQPLNAIVFVWDGIAIGASAFSYLAVAMVVSAAAASSVLLAVIPAGWGLAGVWWGITVLMLVRLGSLAWWHLRGPLSI